MSESKRRGQTGIGHARAAWSAQGREARGRVWRAIGKRLDGNAARQRRLQRWSLAGGVGLAAAGLAIAFFVGGPTGWFTSDGPETSAANEALEAQYAEHFEDFALTVVGEALAEAE